MKKNISINGCDIKMRQNKSYILIDAMYLSKIKDDALKLQHKLSLDKIITNNFPYNDAPYARLNLFNGNFKVNSIKKSSTDEYFSLIKKAVFFSTDSGIILLVEESIFFQVAVKFDYEDLTESDINEINLNYWNKLSAEFSIDTLGLILAPGIDSGFDFEGSGFYKINTL